MIALSRGTTRRETRVSHQADPPVLRGGLAATVPNGDCPSVPPLTLCRSSLDTKEPSLFGDMNRNIKAVPPITPTIPRTGPAYRFLGEISAGVPSRILLLQIDKSTMRITYISLLISMALSYLNVVYGEQRRGFDNVVFVSQALLITLTSAKLPSDIIEYHLHTDTVNSLFICLDSSIYTRAPLICDVYLYWLKLLCVGVALECGKSRQCAQLACNISANI